MSNNQLTDEKIKRRINEIEDRRSASRDFWGGDYEYPEDIEFLALRELWQRRNADGWIMSKNGLPPVNTTVLVVYLAGDVWRVGCGVLSSGHPILADGWYAHGISLCEVGCWMNMPDIPEDEL